MDPHRLPTADQLRPAKRWLQTALAAIGGTALLVVAFFFALFALAAIAAVVAVLGVRWWWMTRKVRRPPHEADDAVEGEYRIVERNARDDPH